jgi:hypothetical protein
VCLCVGVVCVCVCVCWCGVCVLVWCILVCVYMVCVCVLVCVFLCWCVLVWCALVCVGVCVVCVLVCVCDEGEGRGWEVIRRGEKYDQIAFTSKTFSSCEYSVTSLAELMWTGSDTPLSALIFIYLINSSFFYVVHSFTTR